MAKMGRLGGVTVCFVRYGAGDEEGEGVEEICDVQFWG
jgi:hypothetical protein